MNNNKKLANAIHVDTDVQSKSANAIHNAKMRKAFKTARSALNYFYRPECSPLNIDNKRIVEALNAIEIAIEDPPRNCDKCKNADEAVALAIDAGVVDCNFGAREMAEFLLAEMKGGAE